MSGIAFDPWSIDISTWQPLLIHVYFDDSFAVTKEETIRYRDTSNGVDWFFGSSAPDPTTLASMVNVGHNPDVAYRNDSGAIRWYAVVTDFTDATRTSTRVRILRSNGLGAFLPTADSWTIIGTIGESITGGTQNNNPGFAKYPDGRLYENGGMGYVLVTTGPDNAARWKIDQIRFTP